jgi:hypothetical protein
LGYRAEDHIGKELEVEHEVSEAVGFVVLQDQQERSFCVTVLDGCPHLSEKTKLVLPVFVGKGLAVLPFKSIGMQLVVECHPHMRLEPFKRRAVWKFDPVWVALRKWVVEEHIHSR